MQIIEIILKEFECLRNEILDRSKREDQAILWSLTLLIGIITLSTNSYVKIEELIFIIPVTFVLLGTIWVENSFSIFKIGQYIRIEIEDRLPQILNKSEKVLHWQNYLIDKSLKSKSKNIPFIIIPLFYFMGCIFTSIIFQLILICKNDLYNLIHISAIIINVLLMISYFFYWNKVRAKKKNWL